MARINQGILGGFRGSVANVVGSAWKGISVMKSKPVSVANPRSAGQVTQRTTFSNTVALAVLILSDVIKPLWDRFSSKMSGYNDFVSTNIGLFVNAYQSPASDLVISKGKMSASVIDLAAAQVAQGEISLYWVIDSGEGFKLASDIAYILCTSPQHVGEVVIKTNVIRSAGEAVMQLPNNWVAGNEIDVYLAFKRADGTIVSNTAYARTEIIA